MGFPTNQRLYSHHQLIGCLPFDVLPDTPLQARSLSNPATPRRCSSCLGLISTILNQRFLRDAETRDVTCEKGGKKLYMSILLANAHAHLGTRCGVTHVDMSFIRLWEVPAPNRLILLNFQAFYDLRIACV